MSGPFIGPKHDASCFRESGLHTETLRIWMNFGVRCYGDAAFPRSDGLWTNYKRGQITEQQAESQARIQEARAEVEHFFSVTTNNWKLLSNSLELKIGSRFVSNFLFAAVFLTNCLNCCWPNQISQKFAVAPPSVAQYLLYCANRAQQQNNN